LIGWIIIYMTRIFKAKGKIKGYKARETQSEKIKRIKEKDPKQQDLRVLSKFNHKITITFLLI